MRIAQFRAQYPAVVEALALTQDFASLARQCQGEHLDAWLARVAKHSIVALQRFATGLSDDYDAVKAGLTLPWSSGPVEGRSRA